MLSPLCSTGFLAAAFSRNIYLLYLFFGVVAGETRILFSHNNVPD
jgi:hypothetical protein